MRSPEEPEMKKSSTQNVELISRLDERVKNLNDSQKKLEEQLAKISKAQSNLSNKIVTLNSTLDLQDNRISGIESQGFEELEETVNELKMKIQSMEVRVGNNDSRWFLLFDSVWKVVLMLIASYILYKLGWQSPTMP